MKRNKVMGKSGSLVVISKLLSGIAFVFLLLIGNNSIAQCPNDNVPLAGTPTQTPPCGSFTSLGMGGGTYVEFNVVQGADYDFSTCNSGFDTQLTGYDGSFLAFYNDDNGPLCSGNRASVNWTANFSGTLRVNVDQYNCTYSTTSAVLSFRQNDNLSFNPPSPLCEADNAINLNAFSSSAAGSYSGAGVVGSTFDPGVAGDGTHVITFTLGSCSEQATIVVSPAPTITITPTQVSCNGAADGEATANVTGGQTPYTYAWSDPNNQTTRTATNLAPGTYTVTVTDDIGCSNTATATITEPGPISLSIASTSDASCNGVNDGVIVVSVSGGSSPFEYSANGSPYQPSSTFNNLSAGNYTIEVRDNGGCTATASASISNAYSITAVVDSVKDATCPGDNDGLVIINGSGGTAPYQYSLGGAVYQPSGTFNNLSGGSYGAIARDAAGCTAGVQFVINDPDPIAITLDSTQTPGCNGAATGGIFISVDGGTPPYSYSWSNSVNAQDNENIASGTYRLTVTDDNNCSKTFTASISEPSALTLNLASVTNPSCNGSTNGLIDITVNGGTPPYSYSWSNSTFNEDLSNVAAGTYTVDVTDANGCTIDSAFTLTEPDTIATTIVSSASSCSNNATGSVDLTVSGGTPGYTYFWSNGATTQDLTNVAGGAYTVQILDANGCSTSDTAIVTIPSPIAIALDSVDNVLCNGGSTGNIYITVTGGSTPYTYNWSNGALTEDNENIPAGTYTVTVTDINGCTETLQATVTEPSSVNLNLASIADASCNGAANGSIDISVNGGTTPYSFEWSNSSTNEDLSNVEAGTYTVTVTDDNGCALNSTFTVDQPDSISTTVVGTDADCSNSVTGSADLTVTGGTPGYTYFWSNGASTQDLNSVTGGTYTVQILDANGCAARDSVTIGEPTQIEVEVAKKSAGCGDDTDGRIDLTVTGGTAPYSYSWDGRPGVTGPSITNVGSGIYSVTITDDNGCEKIEVIQLSSFPEPLVDFFVEEACVEQRVYFYNNSTITSGSMTFYWEFGDGDTSAVPSPGHEFAEPGTYVVQLTATSNNECSVTETDTIEVFELPSATVFVDGDTVFTECSEQEALLEAVENPDYLYQWSTGENSSSITVTEGGEYSLTVTSENECVNENTVMVRITNPGAISVSNDTTISLGYPAQLEASGGVLYEWTPADFLDNNLVSDPIATPPSDQSYFVSIEDDLGCTYEDTVNITVTNDFALDVPNIITPNGDGFNDVWRIGKILSYPSNQVTIFNRWGNEVFSAKNYNNDWDGGDISDGTYYYIIQFDESETVYKGALTILR